MSAFVVDVNVPIVANGRSPQADHDCVVACAGKLTEVQASGIVVLDDGMRILNEYTRNLNRSGQPGLGDSFMKWVWENQAVDTRCERVSLTPRGDDPDDFAEFPDDPRLAGFDRSDRKYVAVALKSRLNPEILNAVDPDWCDYRPALKAKGLRIMLLCPQCLQ